MFMAILRGLALFAALFILINVGNAFAETITLRTRVEANGAAVTMGDVFIGAPANVAGRAITHGGVMIDLAEMKKIEVDPDAGTGRAEGGVLWAELNVSVTLIL